MNHLIFCSSLASIAHIKLLYCHPTIQQYSIVESISYPIWNITGDVIWSYIRIGIRTGCCFMSLWVALKIYPPLSIISNLCVGGFPVRLMNNSCLHKYIYETTSPFATKDYTGPAMCVINWTRQFECKNHSLKFEKLLCASRFITRCLMRYIGCLIEVPINSTL